MIMDGHTGWEHPMSYTPLYSDVAKFFGQAEAVYSPTFMVGGPGAWNEEYFYQTYEIWKGPEDAPLAALADAHPLDAAPHAAPRNGLFPFR